MMTSIMCPINRTIVTATIKYNNGMKYSTKHIYNVEIDDKWNIGSFDLDLNSLFDHSINKRL